MLLLEQVLHGLLAPNRWLASSLHFPLLPLTVMVYLLTLNQSNWRTWFVLFLHIILFSYKKPGLPRMIDSYNTFPGTLFLDTLVYLLAEKDIKDLGSQLLQLISSKITFPCYVFLTSYKLFGLGHMRNCLDWIEMFTYVLHM